jgi:hypothetical protein
MSPLFRRVVVAALALFPATAVAQVKHVSVVVDVPQASGLFPVVQNGAVAFPATTRDAVGLNISLPPSIYVHADETNGLYTLSQRAPAAPPAAGRPAPAALGVNAVLGGPSPSALSSGHPGGALVEASERASLEGKQAAAAGALAAMLQGAAQKFDGTRGVVRTVDDASAPAYLRPAGQKTLDRNSLVPVSRALARYGMTEKQIRDMIRVYEDSHRNDAPGAYHGRLLGIRAANLMAQFLAGNEPYTEHNAPGETFSQTFATEQITKDVHIKQALILAALFHRTAHPSVKTPTLRDVTSYFASGSELNTWLTSLGPGGPAPRDMIRTLIEQTDYKRSPYDPNNETALLKNFGHGSANWGSEQRRFVERLAGIIQLVTRAAMFVDGPEFAEAAVRARTDEARAGSKEVGRPEISDSEALLSATAELDSLISGRMPAAPGQYISLPRGEAGNNLIGNYQRFRALAASVINARAVTSTVAPEKRR